MPSRYFVFGRLGLLGELTEKQLLPRNANEGGDVFLSVGRWLELSEFPSADSRWRHGIGKPFAEFALVYTQRQAPSLDAFPKVVHQANQPLRDCQVKLDSTNTLSIAEISTPYE